MGKHNKQSTEKIETRIVTAKVVALVRKIICHPLTNFQAVIKSNFDFGNKIFSNDIY